jgi:hypothetical protein
MHFDEKFSFLKGKNLKIYSFNLPFSTSFSSNPKSYQKEISALTLLTFIIVSG